MEIKTQKSFTALSFSVQTNLAGMLQYVRVKARELYKDAANNNLEVTGPVYWIYTGMDGRPETMFTLDIVIPVSKPEAYNGKFAIATVAPLKCLSSIHEGNWEKLAETYTRLFTEIGKKNYIPTGVCREVYLHMDFDDATNNITEVQVGIQ